MEIVEDILGSDERVYVGHVNIASSILPRLPHLKHRPRKHSGVGAPADTASEDVSQHHTKKNMTPKTIEGPSRPFGVLFRFVFKGPRVISVLHLFVYLFNNLFILAGRQRMDPSNSL